MTDRILLTGAGGFVGSHTLAHILTNTDWHVVCLDSFRHKGKTDRLTVMLDNHPDWRTRMTVITHDLAAPISHQMTHRIGDVSAIINMAAESHVDRSITDPVPFFMNNAALAINMLEYARMVRPKIFVQISTDEVYGPCPTGMYAEWASILPSNPYAASKAAQEAAAIAWWRTYGVPVVITNTMNNFGEMQDPEKLIPMVIKNVRSGNIVPIYSNNAFVGSRSYLHARNHADAILYLIENTTPAAYVDGNMVSKPDRYNIVGDEEVTNLAMAQRVADIVGQPLRYELVDFHAARPGHDRRYAIDGSKLRSLGWRAPVDFEASLESTVRWMIDHPEWLL